jgi:hypothetical protein
MKNLMFCTYLLFFSTVTYGQIKDNTIVDNFFYTTLKSGVGEEVQLKFKFGANAIDSIKNSELFKIWESSTFSNPKNEKFITLHKGMDHLNIFLMSECEMASFYAKFELKNQSSYTLLPNSEGFIYFNDKSKMVITFPFKSQNGYGNLIFSKAFYTSFIENGEAKNTHFVSSN